MLWWFFFFKQKTAYEMRISDWSSDVCSSDLLLRGGAGHRIADHRRPRRPRRAERRVMSGRRLPALRIAARLGFSLLVAAILFYTVFPFYWAVVSSLKSGSALFEADLIPWDATLQNYASVFRNQPFARTIVNSLGVAALATALSLLLAEIGRAHV